MVLTIKGGCKLNKKVYLLLCFHNHQPVDNFDHVMEEAYQKAYLPFLKMLAGYPEVKITLHYSGYLLNWLAEGKDEFMTLLSKVIERGQVEILGGGMYEPVLPLLPERDRAGQIEKMAENLRRLFGKRPRGIWLAERVWEPELAMTLRRARVEYLPLDDYHFVKAGLKREELNGYFINEYNGYPVKIFPGLEYLRYTIPFEDPQKTIDFLKELSAGEGASPAAVFADDGEKLGVWPNTYEYVFEGGWLKKFFEMIVHNREWLKTATFGEYVETVPPKGRAYLPTASYPEMGEWTLPPDRAHGFGKLLKERRARKLGDVEDFLHGGYFRNFFAKYGESNQMHKRMLLVSEMVERAKSTAASAELDAMRDNLYRAQNNDAYWHGVFGGLYLPHLRDAVYRNMLRAEKIAENVIKKDRRFWTEVKRGDIDRDGREEVLMRNPKVALVVHPEDGVSLSELSFTGREFNALNVLTRRREGYHHGISEGGATSDLAGGTASIHDAVLLKEGVSVAGLVYDRHTLRSFRDEIYEAGTDTADILRGVSLPIFESANLAGQPSCMMSEEKGAIKVELSDAGSDIPVDLEKIVIIEGAREEVRTRVRLINRTDSPFSCRYGNAWHVNFLAPDADDRHFVSYPVDCKEARLGKEGTVSGATTFGIFDGWQQFTMFFDGKRECDVVYSPIETFSLSEAGVEKVYQGSRILFLYDLVIPPGRFEEIEMRIFLENV
jgi:alpha-amylase